MTKILDITTASATAIKVLLDALKEILLRANFTVTPDGIDMVAIDPTKSAVMQFHLGAENFDKFEIKKDIINLGLNVIKLQRVVTKTLTSNDVLNMSIDESDPGTLSITIDRNKSRTIYRLATTDVDAHSRDIDLGRYNTSVVMGSSDLQKLVRDIHNLTERVEIKVIGKESISFSGVGDKISRETIIDQKDNDAIQIINDPDRMVVGIFDLSFLSIFTRCTNLDASVELFLGQDMPIVLQYRVANLGRVRFLLSDVVSD